MRSNGSNSVERRPNGWWLHFEIGLLSEWIDSRGGHGGGGAIRKASALEAAHRNHGEPQRDPYELKHLAFPSNLFLSPARIMVGGPR
jgi:hypothetical protein